MDMAKPIIRFKGYQDDWEQRKVYNITTSYSGGTPKSGYTEYYDGDIPFIRSGEIYSDKTELFITELGMKNSSAKMVHEGDILYALYGATSGEVSRAKLDGAINQAILAIVPNDDINANFLVEWFRKEKDKITDTYLQGGQGNLSAQIIKELEVTIPSYDEQNKIGLYFEQLNTLITLHQRKCDETKKLKKYMLQKMFPQNGEKVPEIRFSGFTDDWEQRKLSQVVDSIDTGKSKYNVLENGEYEILGSTGTIGYDNSYDYDGDFLLTARVGANAGTLYRHHGKVKITDNTVFLQGNQIDFIYYLLDRFDLKRLSFGSGQPLIKASELKNLELQMPITKEEKDKIANYFVCIDHLITLHQRELENLQNIKKFMLEKMFV